MKITPQMVMNKTPCEEWTKERLEKKLGKGKTLLEILSLEDIKSADRIWCVARFLDDKTNRRFAIWCARQCKTDVKEIKEYIDVIERYYNDDATKDEMDTASSAANSAANRTAYWAADWAAYWAADRAAYNAAKGAAYNAAYNAAYRVADRADMRQKQINKLKELVREGEK